MSEDKGSGPPIVVLGQQENASVDQPLLLGATVPWQEDECTEFKTVFGLKSKHARTAASTTINAFLNGRGGRLWFGISDQGVVCGTPSMRKQVDKFKLWVDSVGQQSNPQVLTLRALVYPLTTKLAVFCVEVPKFECPVRHARGFVYKRLNASTVKCAQLQLYKPIFPPPTPPALSSPLQLDQMATECQAKMKTMELAHKEEIHQLQAVHDRLLNEQGLRLQKEIAMLRTALWTIQQTSSQALEQALQAQQSYARALVLATDRHQAELVERDQLIGDLLGVTCQ